MYDSFFAAFQYLITPRRTVDWVWKSAVLGVFSTGFTLLFYAVLQMPLPMSLPAFYLFVSGISLPFFLLGMQLSLQNLTLQRELSRMALKDALTGLDNRRAFFQKAAGQNGTILMMDVDRFKKVNDTHGHEVGDFVLQEIARQLEVCLRAGDLVARFGGEEFAVLLVDADVTTARQVGQRISAGVHVEPVGRVTLSVGTVGPQDWQGDTTLAFRRADKALYAAKHSGRACVVEWPVEQQAA